MEIIIIIHHQCKLNLMVKCSQHLPRTYSILIKTMNCWPGTGHIEIKIRAVEHIGYTRLKITAINGIMTPVTLQPVPSRFP